MKARLAEEWVVFLLALQFLTRLPLPADVGHTPARMAATPRWHPGVGVVVGMLSGAVFAGTATVLPPMLAALVATAAGVLLTGAFHEDGFADACDGLGGGATRERALEIMRDSRLGTYGAAGLGLMLGAKVLALGSLPPGAVPIVLIAGHAASRASSVLVLATAAYVRDHGTGKPVSDGIGPGGLAFALATGGAALASVAVVLPALAVAGGLAGVILGHAVMRSRFERRLGGYTGDCLGAVQQTSEIGLYLGVLACL
jgi:adenosylcobinamide-GDP ribazoletransferase